jgi:ribosomal protein S18 acetylase RimI-like enzyme
LNVSALNAPALRFYARLGFQKLARAGTPPGGNIYLGKRFQN